MSRKISIALLGLLAACGAAAPSATAPDPSASAAATAPAPSTETASSSSSSSSAPVAASVAPSASAAPPAPVEQTIPIVAFKIVSTDKGGEVLFELKADGTIADKSGTPKGKIDGRSVNFDGFKEPVFVVDEDGGVTWAFAKKLKIRFDDADALTFEDGKKKGKLAVDDKGKIVASGPGMETPPWRIDGMTPPARRAALLLSMSVARKKK